MEKIEKYANVISQFLTEQAEYWQQPSSTIETQIVRDTINHHYQLVRVGWEGDEHVYYCLFHFDIKNGKIWIQENRTEVLPDEEFVAKGIPSKDIVLGIYPPSERIYTDYAVA